MNYLGIDYGRKHLGVARSMGGLAEPVVEVERDKGGKYWGKLMDLALKYDANEVVVGLPEGELTDEVKEFGKRLEERLKLPVKWEDETLSTRDAVAKAAETGKRWRQRRGREHGMAAAVILQNYIDKVAVSS